MKSFQNMYKLFFKKRLMSDSGDGFSLLDLVVAVGLLFILTSGGVLAFAGVSNRAKESAAQNAARTVFDRAIAYKNGNFSDDKTVQNAADEYNSSQKKDENGNPKIFTKVDELENGNIRVTATFNGSEKSSDENIVKVLESEEGSSTPVAGGNENSDDDEEGSAPIEDDITKLTYKCDADTTGLLPSSGFFGDSPNILLKDKNKSDSGELLQPEENVSLKAGITYEVMIEGKFFTLSTAGDASSLAPCLRSVDKIGADSGINSLKFQNAINLEDVPDSIPSTVSNLSFAFSGAKKFNDKSVSNWDTSKVSNMSYIFDGASSFNQDISHWNTSRVTNLSRAFQNASSFNQDIGEWNISKVTILSYAFSGATSFNQNINNWDVSKVTTFDSMFSGASAFNQPLDNWKTLKATTMNSTFANAEKFNQNINSWDVSNVTNMSGMFRNAKSFNQPLNSWNVSNVELATNMFNEASSFNQNISNWDLSKASKTTTFATGSALTTENTPEKMR